MEEDDTAGGESEEPEAEKEAVTTMTMVTQWDGRMLELRDNGDTTRREGG